ncbi:MAG TPA: glycoside hydrolase family 3 N-terminal domain-containing protein [Gaiellaceae bacterium]
MSGLERLALGCILPGFPGHEPPEWLLRLLDAGLGGVVLFAWNVASPEQVRSLTDALRARSPELLIGLDEEGGDVTRLEAAEGSSYPGNLALGVVDDTELTCAVAAAMGGDLARAGVNLNLAPVADVNTNPRNPVIGVRSFGSDPELVARHVVAFVEGTQSQGVAACAKHFPGHGDTSVDSHLALPTAGGDLEAALVPFRAAVDAGVVAVMPGHLLVPGLDDELPASLSFRAVSGLLRGELGFDGLVVSDALEMQAVSASFGVEESAVLALAAGVDALCLGHDLGEHAVERVVRAVVAAVEEGRLAEGRLEQACGRIRAVHVGSSEAEPDRSVGLEVARRALLSSGEVHVGERPLVVELVPRANIAAGAAAHGLGDLLPRGQVVRIHEGEPLPDGDSTRPLVLVVCDAGRHEWQQEAARVLLGRHERTVVVETGLPGWTPAAATGHVVTHGAGRVNLQAAAEVLAPPG